MRNLVNKRTALLAGTGALGMCFWINACKECDSIEDHDSTGVADNIIQSLFLAIFKNALLLFNIHDSA